MIPIYTPWSRCTTALIIAQQFMSLNYIQLVKNHFMTRLKIFKSFPFSLHATFNAELNFVRRKSSVINSMRRIVHRSNLTFCDAANGISNNMNVWKVDLICLNYFPISVSRKIVFLTFKCLPKHYENTSFTKLNFILPETGNCEF